MSNEAINRWTDTANSVLLNRKIVNVRYLTDEEMDAFGWRYKAIVLTLDDNPSCSLLVMMKEMMQELYIIYLSTLAQV
jgi:hypothetical protein